MTRPGTCLAKDISKVWKSALVIEKDNFVHFTHCVQWTLDHCVGQLHSIVFLHMFALKNVHVLLSRAFTL